LSISLYVSYVPTGSGLLNAIQLKSTTSPKHAVSFIHNLKPKDGAIVYIGSVKIASPLLSPKSRGEILGSLRC
jgi:hypothetical protein